MGVGGDGEAQPLGAGDDRGVDADHAPAAVDQRAAGIARVQRRIGLHQVLDRPAAAVVGLIRPELRQAFARSRSGLHRRSTTDRVGRIDFVNLSRTEWSVR